MQQAARRRTQGFRCQDAPFLEFAGAGGLASRKARRSSTRLSKLHATTKRDSDCADGADRDPRIHSDLRQIETFSQILAT